MSTKIAALEELTEGEISVREYQGQKIGVCLLDGEVYAFENVCPHQFGPIVQGKILRDQGTVVCPWHGREYLLENGESPISDETLLVYDITVEDGNVYVDG